MDKDEMSKLATLLNYWLRHNGEHAEEFRQWAEKAKTSGDTETAAELQWAADKMTEANEPLSRALARLKKPES